MKVGEVINDFSSLKLGEIEILIVDLIGCFDLSINLVFFFTEEFTFVLIEELFFFPTEKVFPDLSKDWGSRPKSIYFSL